MTTTAPATAPGIDIEARADEVRERGYTVLEQHLDPKAVAQVAEAFWPMYHAYVAEHDDNPNRGPKRHYISLPFIKPFYQSSIHGDPTIIAIMRAVLGDQCYVTQYATDTPAKGSEHQAVHSDVGPLFPELPDMYTPAAVVAANFSFVDVTPENGPFEVADGTHLLPRDETVEKINAGEIELKPLCLKVGDVLIRDPRCLHRGSPNTTDQPRAVAVYTFERHWHVRGGHLGESPMTWSLYSTLSDDEKYILRRIPKSGAVG